MAARASRRFARLAQAISSTSPAVDLKHPDRPAGSADDLIVEGHQLQNMTGVGIRRPRRGIGRHRREHVIGDADTFAPLFVERRQFRSGLPPP